MDLKRLYRFFLFREALLQRNTSGLYTLETIRSCIRITPTMRRDLKDWCRLRLIEKKGSYIKLNKLTGTNAAMHKTFCNFRMEIESAESSGVYFADLYKKRIIHAYAIAQAYKEKEKIEDDRTAKKYLKHVRSNIAFLGVKEGIYLAFSNIGRLLGRSRTTSHKAITRMRKSALIKSKQMIQFTGYRAHEFEQYRKASGTYGRLLVKNGLIYQRLANSYCFA